MRERLMPLRPILNPYTPVTYLTTTAPKETLLIEAKFLA